MDGSHTYTFAEGRGEVLPIFCSKSKRDLTVHSIPSHYSYSSTGRDDRHQWQGKGTAGTDGSDGPTHDDGGKDSGDFIERDTLIKLNVKKGGQISSQYYRVLKIFDKS